MKGKAWPAIVRQTTVDPGRPRPPPPHFGPAVPSAPPSPPSPGRRSIPALQVAPGVLPPAAAYDNVVKAGAAKAALPASKTLLMGVMAGCYISLGGFLAISVGNSLTGARPAAASCFGAPCHGGMRARDDDAERCYIIGGPAVTVGECRDTPFIICGRGLLM